MTVYTAYFKRQPGNVNGVFTIQSYDTVPIKLFNQMPARSGEPMNPDSVWEHGVGALPKGKYFLWLRDPVDPGPDFPTTPGGIGKAYRISNSMHDHDTIFGPEGKTRSLVRLHPENEYPGSAGCCALVWNNNRTLTPIPALKAEVVRLFAWLDGIGKTLEFIDMEVL